MHYVWLTLVKLVILAVSCGVPALIMLHAVTHVTKKNISL